VVDDRHAVGRDAEQRRDVSNPLGLEHGLTEIEHVPVELEAEPRCASLERERRRWRRHDGRECGDDEHRIRARQLRIASKELMSASQTASERGLRGTQHRELGGRELFSVRA